MSDPLVRYVLVLLAFAGGVALVLRVVGALLRLALHAAEETAASGLADASARRGDLTGHAERRARLDAARARRRRQLAAFAGWLLWLAVPPVAGWLPLAYAPAALLWLLPRPPGPRAVILRRPPNPPPPGP